MAKAFGRANNPNSSKKGAILATSLCSRPYNFSPTLDGRYGDHTSELIYAYCIYVKYCETLEMDWWSARKDGTAEIFCS